MPQPFKTAILTDAGARLLTRSLAGEITVEFTKMAVGNGEYDDVEKSIARLQKRTKLMSQKNIYSFSDISIHDEHSVKLTSLITNQDPYTKEVLVDEGYYINEIGIFARESGNPDAAEVLYSISITSGDRGDYMPAYNGHSPAQITQDFFVTVGNSGEVTIHSAGAVLLRDGDAKDVTVTFNEAEKRENISTKEKLSVILGKIQKWFADLHNVAFSGSYNDLTDKPSIPTTLPANGGNADKSSTLAIPRVQGNADYKPGSNVSEIKEFNSGSTNLPNAAWYHILSSEGSDSNFVTKLALGMTIPNIYYKAIGSGNNNWLEIITSNNIGSQSVASVKDRTNGNTTYLNYGANCVENPTYLAAWNGYELRAFNKADVADLIGALKLSGGSMSGKLTFSDINNGGVQYWIYSFYGRYNGVNIGGSGNNSIDFAYGNSKGWLGEQYGISMHFYPNSSYLQPMTNGGAYLGSSDHRWNQIYSTNSAISTSDCRAKYDISYIGSKSPFDTQLSEEQLEQFIKGLLPCVYKLIDGESGRPHHGLIAQDIEELMHKIGLSDHAGFIKSPKTKEVEVEKEIEKEIEDPDTGEKKVVKEVVKELKREEIPGEYIYSLRYEEFIADIIRFVQLQNDRIDNLEVRLEASERKVEDLETRLKHLENLLSKQ